MRFTYGVAGHASILAGIVLSLFGMLSNTGLMDLGLPTQVMFVGFVLLIGGMAVLYAIEKYGFGNNVPEPQFDMQDGVIDLSPTTVECEDSLLTDGTSSDTDASAPVREKEE